MLIQGHPVALDIANSNGSSSLKDGIDLAHFLPPHWELPTLDSLGRSLDWTGDNGSSSPKRLRQLIILCLSRKPAHWVPGHGPTQQRVRFVLRTLGLICFAWALANGANISRLDVFTYIQIANALQPPHQWPRLHVGLVPLVLTRAAPTSAFLPSSPALIFGSCQLPLAFTSSSFWRGLLLGVVVAEEEKRWEEMVAGAEGQRGAAEAVAAASKAASRRSTQGVVPRVT